MNDKIHVAMIYGSAREGRLCDTVGRWAAAQISERPEYQLEVIDPLMPPFTLHRERYALAQPSAFKHSLVKADAFIIVTPEYNHGYPAVLKLLIDSAYAEWQAKPVAFISYGGMSSGLRAVEQLRQVFAELHVVSIRDTVSFINVWDQFDAGEKPKNEAAARKAMSIMLAQLHWWASALRHARNAIPYSKLSE